MWEYSALQRFVDEGKGAKYIRMPQLLLHVMGAMRLLNHILATMFIIY